MKKILKFKTLDQRLFDIFILKMSETINPFSKCNKFYFVLILHSGQDEVLQNVSVVWEIRKQCSRNINDGKQKLIKGVTALLSLQHRCMDSPTSNTILTVIAKWVAVACRTINIWRIRVCLK